MVYSSVDSMQIITALFICVFRDFTLDIPAETRKNGTLFLHLFLLPRSRRVLEWNDASEAKDRVYTRVPLTQFLVPASATYQLLTGN